MGMFKETNIVVLAGVAAIGYTLAILGAISTLWTDIPSDAGRLAFGSALIVSFTMVCGNLIFMAVHLLASKSASHQFFDKMSGAMGVIIFIVGILTSAILFVEGLGAWSSEPIIMPDPLIILVRFNFFLPVLWLCLYCAFAMWPGGKKRVQAKK